MIGRLVEILLATGADMSCCRWHNVGRECRGSRQGRPSPREPSGRFIAFDQPGKHYQGVFSVLLRKLTRSELYYFSEANWGKLYRRSLFEGIRFPEHRYAQDVAIAMHLYQRMRPRGILRRQALLLASAVRQRLAQSQVDALLPRHRPGARRLLRCRARRRHPSRARVLRAEGDPAERRSVSTAADRELYEADRRYVAARLSSLPRWQRVAVHRAALDPVPRGPAVQPHGSPPAP